MDCNNRKWLFIFGFKVMEMKSPCKNVDTQRDD